MPAALLATKLYIPPPPPRFVARPRLLQRLNAARPAGLTLVSASAGFGKTTLISEWIQTKDEGTLRGLKDEAVKPNHPSAFILHAQRSSFPCGLALVGRGR